MANVLLGVTGSVAAIYTPDLFRAIAQAGHQVKVVATAAASYFFDPAAIEPIAGQRNLDVMILDEDEWPGQNRGRFYQRSDTVLHIELRRWADMLVIAPLDANTLGKLAYGLADNCLTCVARAWDRSRPVILAPAMNTLMWDHPATIRQLRLIAEDCQAGNVHSLLPPREGLGDVGAIEGCTVAPLLPPGEGLGDVGAIEGCTVAPLLPPGEGLRDVGAIEGCTVAPLLPPGEGLGVRDALSGLVAWINKNCPALHILYPQTKRLACDDVGVGAMADRDSILAAIGRMKDVG